MPSTRQRGRCVSLIPPESRRSGEVLKTRKYFLFILSGWKQLNADSFFQQRGFISEWRRENPPRKRFISSWNNPFDCILGCIELFSPSAAASNPRNLPTFTSVCYTAQRLNITAETGPSLLENKRTARIPPLKMARFRPARKIDNRKKKESLLIFRKSLCHLPLPLLLQDYKGRCARLFIIRRTLVKSRWST